MEFKLSGIANLKTVSSRSSGFPDEYFGRECARPKLDFQCLGVSSNAVVFAAATPTIRRFFQAGGLPNESARAQARSPRAA
jgi:hypothetical protein